MLLTRPGIYTFNAIHHCNIFSMLLMSRVTSEVLLLLFDSIVSFFSLLKSVFLVSTSSEEECSVYSKSPSASSTIRYETFFKPENRNFLVYLCIHSIPLSIFLVNIFNCVWAEINILTSRLRRIKYSMSKSSSSSIKINRISQFQFNGCIYYQNMI